MNHNNEKSTSAASEVTTLKGPYQVTFYDERNLITVSALPEATVEERVVFIKIRTETEDDFARAKAGFEHGDGEPFAATVTIE